MSDEEPAPRRSTRERRPTQQFISVGSQKRKRSPESGDEAEENPSEHGTDSEVSEPDNDDDDEPDYKAPSQLKRKTPAKVAKPPVAKKPRVATGTATKRKPRAVFSAKDASIEDDNALFNAFLNPATALQATVQDFMDSFESTPELALADLITCVFRCCGCNASVNSDEVVDSDGVVEFLSDRVEEIKTQENQGYPLISKSPGFKKFRRSLSEFFERLVASGAENESVYFSELMPTLQSWIVAMSSAQLRSFRHTATVIALEVESALCTIAAELEQSLKTLERQRETEQKRRKGTKSLTEREKSLVAKVNELKPQSAKVDEYLRELFDGVFVHRYRDADAGIRADCVRELGVWLQRYPSYFVEGNYLRYVGWVLSDANVNVRLEAVKSLHSLYVKGDHLITLQHFAERFNHRLTSMATSDVDLPVRVAVIQVLGAIDSKGLLGEEYREPLCLLVFAAEPKIQKAVGGFVKGVWEEAVSQRLVGRQGSDKDRTGLRVLASLLVSWERALEKQSSDDDARALQEEESQSQFASGSSQFNYDAERRGQEIAVLGAEAKSRIASATEALWDEIKIVQDWETLLDLLLLDHSAPMDDDIVASPTKKRAKRPKVMATPAKKRKGMNPKPSKNNNADDDDDTIDEAWRLEEVEENVLIEVFLASLKKTLSDSKAKKGEDFDTVQANITRVLIQGLPKLFSKHQTDPNHIADILTIPSLMNLDLYLELRMMTAYEALWDDITKQFLTQSSPIVLHNATAAITHLLSNITLANTNGTKILELEDELAVALREAVTGRDELDIAALSEDDVHSLGAIISRIVSLLGLRDLSGWMEEDEGGKQTPAWDIMNALAERGRLGVKDEELLTEKSIQALTLHITWRTRVLMFADIQAADYEETCTTLTGQRDTLLSKLVEFVSGAQSNVSDGVKRVSFQSIITLHVLFPPTNLDNRPEALAQLALRMDDKLQHQCAGFIQAELERFSDEIRELEATHNADSDGSDADNETVRGKSGSDDDDESSDDGRTTPKKSKSAKAKHSAKSDPKKPRLSPDNLLLASRALMEAEFVFASIVFYFMRAIHIGAIDTKHSAILLAYHGRLGGFVDHCTKPIVEKLQSEGMYQHHGDVVVHVVTESVRQSFEMFMDGSSDNEDNTVSLVKSLASSFIIRGAQLSVLRRLDGQYVTEIHTSSLSWIIKRIAGYESSGNKKKRNNALKFFKVLQVLLASVQSRDATKIKLYMDKALETAKLEVPASSKSWDAQRSYETRLLKIMSKDNAIVAKGKKSARGKAKDVKSADVITSDEGEEIEDPDVDDGGADGAVAEPTPSRPKPKPKAKPKLKAKAKAPPAPSTPRPVRSTRNTRATQVETSPEPEPSTPKPKARPKPKPKAQSRRASTPPQEEEEIEDIDIESAPPSPPSSQAGKKRRRDADDDGSDDGREGNDDDEEEDEERAISALVANAGRHEKPSSQASQVSLANFKSNRKRARR